MWYHMIPIFSFSYRWNMESYGKYRFQTWYIRYAPFTHETAGQVWKDPKLRRRQMFAFYPCCLIGLGLGFASELQFVPALSEAIGYFPMFPFEGRCGMKVGDQHGENGAPHFFQFPRLKKEKHAAKTRGKVGTSMVDRCPDSILPGEGEFSFLNQPILLMFLHERCLLTMDSAHWRTVSLPPSNRRIPSDFRWFQGIETSGARAAAPAVAWHPTRSHAFVALARFGSHAVGCATYRKGYLNQGTITNPTMGSSENHRLKSAQTGWNLWSFPGVFFGQGEF